MSETLETVNPESTGINKTNTGALATLTLVFFFWGFIAAGNGIFIPFCRDYFHLDQFQGMLIDFAFYGAYYLGALGLFIFGSKTGRDLVGGWGYKKSIVFGLIFSALGAGAMIISLSANQFSGMLIGLFIVALGFSLQQTAANPFMISLGDESTGASRINLGGGINSLGTTLGPLIVALALFGTSAAVSSEDIAKLDLNKVIILYAFVGVLFLGIAALFGFSKKVPAGKNEGKQEPAKKAVVSLVVITGLLIACFSPVFSSYTTNEAKEIAANETQMGEMNASIDKQIEASGVNMEALKKSERTKIVKAEYSAENAPIVALQAETTTLKRPIENWRMMWLTGALLVILIGLLSITKIAGKAKEGWGAMQYPQLTFGMLAIFVYVGVEVAVGSNLGELLAQERFGGYNSSQIAPFIAMFWGSLMIGRWAGAINAFDLKMNTKQFLRFVVPLIAFGVILLLTALAGHDITLLYWYIICVVAQIVAFYLTKDKPALTLTVFASLALLAMIVGLMSKGMLTVYSFLSAGLFCSIMWPCIFSLSLAGLGKYQTQGSAFLVMMILGGGVIPLIQAKLVDIIGAQNSFVVAAVCFAYLALFAILVKRFLAKRGVSMD